MRMKVGDLVSVINCAANARNVLNEFIETANTCRWADWKIIGKAFSDTESSVKTFMSYMLDVFDKY
jgi:hypothetical protein